jgi:hypothetical protein
MQAPWQNTDVRRQSPREWVPGGSIGLLLLDLRLVSLPYTWSQTAIETTACMLFLQGLFFEVCALLQNKNHVIHELHVFSCVCGQP